MAVKIGAKIATGYFAEVYAYGSDHVLKLYYPGEHDKAQREALSIQIANNVGAPAPRFTEMFENENRIGFVMERIKGPSLTDLSAKKPWRVNHFSRLMVGLHLEIHKLSGEGLPNQLEEMRFYINQSDGILGKERDRVLAILPELLKENRLCHNDLHQENIILSSKGPVVLDWAEATCGNPVADVLHAWLIQNRPVPVPGKPQATQFYTAIHNRHRKWFGDRYLKVYCRQSGIDPKVFEKWKLPVAASRLIPKPINEKHWTEQFVRGLISDLHETPG